MNASRESSTEPPVSVSASAGWAPLLRFVRDSLREWRSPDLRVLASSLVIAVAAFAAVAFFTDRVDRSMTQQAATLLGGDLAVVSNGPIPPEWLQEAARRGLQATRSATLPSVVFTPEEEALLVSVRAVDHLWPLRGHVDLVGDPDPDLRHRGPEVGEAWGDGALLEGLQLRPDSPIELGLLRLQLTAQIRAEPDRGSSLFEIAPRLLIHFADLERSGLVGAGSRVRYQFLAAGPASGIAAFQDWIVERLEPGQRLRDLEDANPELRTAVERARRFLGLASMMAVLLAGAAIAVAAHHYAQQRADTAAVMRALGAQRRQVLRYFLLRLLSVAILASLLGLMLGFLAQFALSTVLREWLTGDLPPPGWRPVVAGLGVGLVTAVGFALPALLRIGRVSPLRVLQRNLGLPPASAWLTGSLALLAFGLLLYSQAGDPALALWVLLGTGGALLVLGGLGVALMILVRPWRDRGGMAVRFGLANLSRRGGLSALQMMAFSLGLLALLLLGIVRVDLLSEWERSIPAAAPNLFFVNIQPGEEQGFADRVEASGLPRPWLEPMIRGRLVAVNDRAVTAADYADDRARRLLERDFNLSAADTLPHHNRLLSGRWFDLDAPDPGEWSVESGLMERFDLRLGDTLTFRIAGENISGRITSVREVNWDSFQVNFFVIGHPALLATQPRTYITSLYLPAELEREKNQWLRAYPSVSAIDVAVLLAQVRVVIGQATRAVEYVFLFTLLAGLMVLYAAVQSTRETRRRETALLRTLGARREQIRTSLLAEFGTLGLLSGLLAALIATLIGALLAWKIFGFAYTTNPMTFLVGILGGTLGIGLAGWLGTRQVLQQSPLRVLRGPE